MENRNKFSGPFQIIETTFIEGGVVTYRATDTRTDETVLLYTFGLDDQADSAAAQHFQQQAAANRRLQHEHLLAIREIKEVDGFVYAVTEALPERTLADLLQQNSTPLALAEATAIVDQIAAALDYLHEQGLLHLQLTPANIWLTPVGGVKVAGFGRSLAAAAGQAQTALAAVTPYSAPEQVGNEPTSDQRTDVYSLGAIAFHMLTAKAPFAGTPLTLGAEISRRPPTAPEMLNPQLSTSVVAVLRFVLAKEPNARYARAGEFAAALHQAQAWGGAAATATVATPPPAAAGAGRRRNILVGFALLAIMLLIGILLPRTFQNESLTPVPTSATRTTPIAVAQQSEATVAAGPTTAAPPTPTVLPAENAGASALTPTETVVDDSATAADSVTVQAQTVAAITNSVASSVTNSVTNSVASSVTSSEVTSLTIVTATATIAPSATATLSPTDTDTVAPTDTATPIPTATATTVPTDTPAPSATATTSATATETASATETVTNSPAPTDTPASTDTEAPVDAAAAPRIILVPTNTPVPSATDTSVPTATATSTDTPVPTATTTPLPTDTVTPTETPAPTDTNTVTATPAPTDTATPLPTDTNTVTATPAPTDTATPLPTDTVTQTETPAPTETSTVTNTPLPTDTATMTATPLPTDTATPRPTDTVTQTETPAPTESSTATNTPLPTDTATPLPTDTSTQTETPAPTRTSTVTNTPLPADTATVTPRSTSTSTTTRTNTPLPTRTPTQTSTRTRTQTSTRTPTPRPTLTRTATATVTNTSTNTPLPSATSTATVAPPLLLNAAVTPQANGGTAVLTGSGEPGATIQVLVNDQVVGSTLVQANGRWFATVPLAQAGQYRLNVRSVVNGVTVEAVTAPVGVALPTRAPTSTPTAVTFALVAPADGESGNGSRIFSWQTSFTPGEGEAFELVFWPPDADPMKAGFGMAAPTTANQLRLDLSALDDVLKGMFEPGEYNWGVLLVRTAPYERLRLLGGPRKFRYYRPGGNSSGGGGGGGQTSGEGNP